MAADTEKAADWIARHQKTGRNIYFQVNETPARCSKKPNEGHDAGRVMPARRCRPSRTAITHTSRSVTDSANLPLPCTPIRSFHQPRLSTPATASNPCGQSIRQPLTPEIIEITEAENRAIEAAVGAAGTYNIDRLLRLPGTLNFPNAKKQRLGRGVTRARLLHHTNATYTTEQAATLATHLQGLLAGTGLVGLPAETEAKPKKKRATKRDRIDRSALAMGKGAACRRRGMSFDEMVQALRNDPETAEWCNEKGDANDKRELHRIWDKAGEAADEIDRVIAEFNAKFMVVNEAGKALIYAPAHDPILRRRYHNRMGAADLRLLYQNRRVEVGVTEDGNAILAPVADVWLRHDNRRQFIGGIIFDPSGTPTPPDTLNLWQGFAVTPKPGSWEKLRLHVRDVICRGNPRTIRIPDPVARQNGPVSRRTGRSRHRHARPRGHR